VVGDVRDPATVDTLLERLGRPADVVLSDLAPKLTGIRATDEARS
jgi:23S rRNA U2552 (ribose-2'-O)-methylase RlmE/FtsJ